MKKLGESVQVDFFSHKGQQKLAEINNELSQYRKEQLTDRSPVNQSPNQSPVKSARLIKVSNID